MTMPVPEEEREEIARHNHPVRDWRPLDHIREACMLIEGSATSAHGAEVSALIIARAQTHCAIAQAKMIGGQRA